MITKPIVLLALLQMTAIGYGILATAAFCKLGRVSLESGGYPVPGGYAWAVWYRDYGILLSVMVVIWVVFVCLRSSPPHNMAWSSILFSGAGLALAFFLVGSFFALCAMTPMMRLL